MHLASNTLTIQSAPGFTEEVIERLRRSRGVVWLAGAPDPDGRYRAIRLSVTSEFSDHAITYAVHGTKRLKFKYTGGLTIVQSLDGPLYASPPPDLDECA